MKAARIAHDMHTITKDMAMLKHIMMKSIGDR